MEQQNHKQSDKRIHILIGLAAVAMITGMAGLFIALMKPASPPQPPSSFTPAGSSMQPNSSYQEIINDAAPDGPPKRGSASNN